MQISVCKNHAIVTAQSAPCVEPNESAPTPSSCSCVAGASPAARALRAPRLLVRSYRI